MPPLQLCVVRRESCRTTRLTHRIGGRITVTSVVECLVGSLNIIALPVDARGTVR